MKIKLLTSRSGIGFSQSRGEVIDVPEAECHRMVDAGQAEFVRAKVAERAIPKNKYEKAVKG